MELESKLMEYLTDSANYTSLEVMIRELCKILKCYSDSEHVKIHQNLKIAIINDLIVFVNSSFSKLCVMCENRKFTYNGNYSFCKVVNNNFINNLIENFEWNAVYNFSDDITNVTIFDRVGFTIDWIFATSKRKSARK